MLNSDIEVQKHLKWHSQSLRVKTKSKQINVLISSGANKASAGVLLLKKEVIIRSAEEHMEQTPHHLASRSDLILQGLNRTGRNRERLSCRQQATWHFVWTAHVMSSKRTFLSLCCAFQGGKYSHWASWAWWSKLLAGDQYRGVLWCLRGTVVETRMPKVGILLYKCNNVLLMLKKWYLLLNNSEHLLFQWEDLREVGENRARGCSEFSLQCFVLSKAGIISHVG